MSLEQYARERPAFRTRVLQHKGLRQLAVGPNATWLFEDRLTVQYQVQEMLRTERISDERSIAHELETYNELIPGPGSLSATLFIEYDEPGERSKMLARLASLRQQVALRVGSRVCTARFGTHFGEELDRLPAVNYLTFTLGTDAASSLRDPNTPAALVVSHPDYALDQPLPATLREELASDLDG
jgi:hypothetical protein